MTNNYVYFLYDHHDLVDVFASRRAAEEASNPHRETGIRIVGNDCGIEIVKVKVKR